ncbi:LADA_0D12706g1_1 [Lachancea dasiensis]|uniref:LADA_0D12706g1_1 n=1 Tax=Lachancea dasiensis TaxID=1072105 RepID=A0A1G4J8F2_9SACH|nr:LADA_0D12706g1_1 [Lachancea dasiensis]
MKIAGLVLLASLAAADVQGLYEKWTSNDLEQYLHDQKQTLQKAGSENVEVLRKHAADAWNKQTQPTPWWKFWASRTRLADFANNQDPISEWFFDTWTAKDLRKLLSKSKVKYNSDLSRDALVSKAKENFQKISDSNQLSGLYPSQQYFANWDEYDLKAWLDEYRIPYEKSKAKKDELLAKVRENIYAASRFADDERLNLLDTLDFADQELVDKAGKVKEQVFNSWSTREIEDWLRSHKVKLEDSAAHDRKYVLGLANKNKKLLQDDAAWYLEASKKKASPFFSKSEAAVASVWDQTLYKWQNIKDYFYQSDNVVNHTFLLGVETWPKKRLRAFLDARGVSYPILSTRADLLELVKQYRNRPLTNLASSPAVAEFFDGWSFENLKGWIKAQSDDITSTDVYKAASSKVSDLAAEAQKQGENAWLFAQRKGEEAADYAQEKGSEAAHAAADYAAKKGADAKTYAGDVSADAATYAKEKGSDAAAYAQDKGADAAAYAQEKGADAAIYAQEKGSDAAAYAAAYAKEKSGDAAEYIKEKGSDAMDLAQEKTADAASAVREKGSELYDAANTKVDEWTALFSSWSTDDLRNYAKSFGIKTAPTTTRERLVEQAKENTQWFFGYYQDPLYKRVPKKISKAVANGYQHVVHH